MLPPTIVLLAALLALEGCGTAPSAAPASPAAVTADEQLEFTRLYTQPMSDLKQRTELVVRDPAALDRAWGQLGSQGPGKAPTVDFGGRMVIVVGLGERTSGGYSVRVDAVVREGNGLVVRYTESAPGPLCMSLTVMTAPVEVISVPRVTGPVRFEAKKVETAC